VLVANNKTVTKIEDANLGSSISFTLDDTIKITGYSVYKSLIKISGKVYIHIS
jgi:allophanate hydrolase subunit 2